MERSTLHGTGQTAPASTVDKPETETCKKKTLAPRGVITRTTIIFRTLAGGCGRPLPRWVPQTPFQMGAADPVCQQGKKTPFQVCAADRVCHKAIPVQRPLSSPLHLKST